MRFGFVGAAYTSRSTAIADEEAVNWFPETLESQGAIAPAKAYGGAMAPAMRSYYGTPGLKRFGGDFSNWLQNPTFANGNASGWVFQAGWAMGTGAPFANGYEAEYTWPAGSGTVTQSSIINNAAIPAPPGTVVTASCQAIGELNATGFGVLYIAFYDATGTLIPPGYYSPQVTNTYIWTPLSVTATAPAGSATAYVIFAVENVTSAAGRWAATQFVAGYSVGSALPASVLRGQCWTGSRLFVVADGQLLEVASDGTRTVRGTVPNDGKPVSMAFSSVQMLVVSALHAYCYDLSTNALTEVTSLLAGNPVDVDYVDGYFVVSFQDSNKFQMSNILDGTTWPGLYVNEVSVFADDITAIIANHRELWVFGNLHGQPFQNTGSDNIFDVIPGCLLETGCAATYAPVRLDNSIFWVGEDERGARSCWRSQGYTPVRVSTHAIETDLSSYASIADVVSYAYKDGGHLLWVLYVPEAPWSWVYDVSEGLWHKRAKWVNGAWQPHWGWNHSYAFEKHIIGDWGSGNLYQMSMDFLDDNGNTIRRLRRAPTVGEEMQWVQHADMTVDFDTGQGTINQPQPADAASSSGTAVSTVAAPGSALWNTPSNVFQTSFYTTSAWSTSPYISQYLQATGLGFALPSDATVTGIQISYQAAPTAGSVYITGYLLQNGVQVGTSWTVTLAAGLQTYTQGGDGYLFGVDWTPALINDPNGLGVQLQAGRPFGGSGSGAVEVNSLTVTVAYNFPEPQGPQAMLRWSDDRGKTWSNEHWVDCGQAGNYKTRAVWRRLGRSRYRVYELTVTDSAKWALVDAYLHIPGQP